MHDKLEKLKDKALRLTDKPGVYLMKNKKNEVIYVGKAKVLRNRVVSYFRKFDSHDEKVFMTLILLLPIQNLKLWF